MVNLNVHLRNKLIMLYYFLHTNSKEIIWTCNAINEKEAWSMFSSIKRLNKTFLQSYYMISDQLNLKRNNSKTIKNYDSFN
ncbi:uncharacterized protein METZ01_LOCUS510901 [marine metagenome]|uniref:Uncharacterized protein n=1 Tax=marine metagenome TaxID=408172 RepID=A0A383EMG7_9ZZZZ